MSFTEIQVDNKGEFSGQGRMGWPVQELQSSITMPALLKKLVFSFVGIQKSYGQSLHLDNKLQGRERITLVDHLDECVNLLVAMRAHLDKNTTFASSEPEMGRRLQFHLDMDRWRATGNLGQRRKLKSKQMVEWLNRMSKERLPAIVKFFGEISRDGVLTEEEIAGMNKLLDRLFFSILLVREEILSGDMG